MMRSLGHWMVIVALAAPATAAAQPRNAVNSPGFLQEQNQDQPIQIEAATLEVRDKEKMATFAGDVQVVQGDTTIKCQSLVVFYGGDRAAPGRPAKASPPQAQAGVKSGPGAALSTGANDIRRIEARGGVTVISKDQNASGDLGVYDLRKKTITLTGNVVVSQGKNVLHGDRVVVDTVTGNAHFESNSSGPSRVRALIQPGKGGNGAPTNIMTIGPGRQN
ncbi:MAG: LPS ABC transporter substrate-binding protein LptA [Hyphomicrobiales bacterium]|nr:LPS ABC transporter substrate-binding protein LptA [Hyphomicrobiales bacterium]MDE2286109.1 LPS ABC transporter substrate-binding protein LptA [Hyphomicrobiales bacterium]MDE2373636.1 LPS ABC transporter substrate-binding protein LptA [Hyphomicrobiales bacterium]